MFRRVYLIRYTLCITRKKLSSLLSDSSFMSDFCTRRFYLCKFSAEYGNLDADVSQWTIVDSVWYILELLLFVEWRQNYS